MSNVAAETYGETWATSVDEALEALLLKMQVVRTLAEEQQAEGKGVTAIVRAVNEKAGATGAPKLAQEALDEAVQLVQEIFDRTGKIGEEIVDAEKATRAARKGMAPAKEAEDELRTAQAHGEVVQQSQD